MVTVSSKTSSRLAERITRPMTVTSRDLDLLVTVSQLPQIDRARLERLHFADLAQRPGYWTSSVGVRRLRVLTSHSYLLRRRLPLLSGSGSAPYCYTLGHRAVPLVAERLDLPIEAVRRRQEADARLSFMLHPHRRLLADTFIAFQLGCRARGYTFTWRTELDIAALDERVTVAGKAFPIRPDAACYLGNLPRGGTAFVLEIQVASDPAKYLQKCRAYQAYYASGQYQRTWGYKSLRVLAVTTSEARARNLCNVVHQSSLLARPADKALFWSTWREALERDVWGDAWLRADVGSEQRFRLLGP